MAVAGKALGLPDAHISTTHLYHLLLSFLAISDHSHAGLDSINMGSQSHPFPAWADAALSDELVRICQSGESQTVEFKQTLPKQSRDLAKEIAAFAGSNEGLLLIGVEDSGDVVGLNEANDAVGRDHVVERIAGICRTIRPPVHPQMVWAISDTDLVVLAIKIQRGEQPLYYVDGRPYVRRASSSRPAEPEEVIEAVRLYLACRGLTATKLPASSTIIRALAGTLAATMRWAELDIDLRTLQPWFQENRSFAGTAARNLRDWAADESADELGIRSNLQGLAEHLEAIADDQPTCGNDGNIDAVWEAARTESEYLMKTVVYPVPLAIDAEADVKRALEKTARKLHDHWNRAAKDIFGGLVDSGRSEFGLEGRRLMDWSYFHFNFLTPDQALALRDIGKRLIKLEARTMYGDGGHSQLSAVEEGLGCASALTALLTQNL